MRRRATLAAMSDAPRLGWWQASDGEWYPPELHPNHRHAAPPPQPHGHGIHHARVVHPAHHRIGAGDYTVKPVRKLSALSLGLLIVLVSAVLLVGVGAAAKYWIIDAGQSGSARAAPTTLSVAERCASDKRKFQLALLEYKAKYGGDAIDEHSLIPEFLPDTVPGWEYVNLGQSTYLQPVDSCR